MIRSNLKHGGKTPYGPDLDKSKRDESICEIVFPLLQMIMDIILEYPSKKLICYGTLKNGKINDILLRVINTNSKNVFIFGSIYKEDEYFYYKFDNLKNKLSEELIINNDFIKYFGKLDKHEGKLYKRVLIPFEDNNEIYVGNIYEDNRSKKINN